MRRWLPIILVICLISTLATAQDLVINIEHNNQPLPTQQLQGNLYLCGEDPVGVSPVQAGTSNDLKTYSEHDVDRGCFWQHSPLELTCEQSHCSFSSQQPIITPYRVAVFIPSLERLVVAQPPSSVTQGTLLLSIRPDGSTLLTDHTSFFETKGWYWFIRLASLALIIELLLAFAFLKFYRLSLAPLSLLFILDLIFLPIVWFTGLFIYIQAGFLWSQVLLLLPLRFYLTQEILYQQHHHIFVRHGAITLTLITQITSLIAGIIMVVVL